MGKFQKVFVALGIATLFVTPVAITAVNAASNTATAYTCFRPNGIQDKPRIQLTPPDCADGAWQSWQTVSEPGTVTTTTAPQATTTTAATTTTVATTTTTQPAGSYRDVVLADGPIAYWRFANTSSETGTHNGTLRGSPLPLLNQPGPFAGSQSIRIDGVQRDNTTTQGFLANSIARLTSTAWANGFTAEAWAKTTTSGPEQHVFSWTTSAGDSGVRIFYDDPDNRWRYGDGNITLTQSGSTTINEWHHLVATVDASGNGRLYVDGQQVASWSNGRMPVASSGGLFVIGADYDSHDCPCPHVSTPFDGWIAEVAVYNKPLSQVRVQAHFVAR